MSWDNDALTSFVDRLAEHADGDDPLFKVFGLDDTAACGRAYEDRVSTDVHVSCRGSAMVGGADLSGSPWFASRTTPAHGNVVSPPALTGSASRERKSSPFGVAW